MFTIQLSLSTSILPKINHMYLNILHVEPYKNYADYVMRDTYLKCMNMFEIIGNNHLLFG